jgi:hypothetical protein
MRQTTLILAAMGLLAVGAVSALAQEPVFISPPLVFFNSGPTVTPGQGLIYYGGPVWSRNSVPSPFPTGPAPYYTYHSYYPGYYTSGYYANYPLLNQERHRAGPYRFYSLGPR